MHATVVVAIVALPVVCFFGRETTAVMHRAPTATGIAIAIAIPVTILALVGLALVVPAKVPKAECAADEFRVAADRQARVTFGTRGDPTIALADAKTNVALLRKRNRQISEALDAATSTSAEIVPGFDACRGKLYYFVDSTDHFATAPDWASFTGKLLSPENPVVVGP